jgi:hypothetical protein
MTLSIFNNTNKNLNFKHLDNPAADIPEVSIPNKDFIP